MLALWEFPGGLVVRIPGFHCCGQGSIPGKGTVILQATCHPHPPKKLAFIIMYWMHRPTDMVHSFTKYLLKAYDVQGISVNIKKDTRYSYQKKKAVTGKSPFSAWNEKQVIAVFWAGAEYVCVVRA